MILWSILAAITLVVSASLLWPLLRRRHGSAEAADYDIQVYRSQLAEVEQNLANGQLSASEAAAARTEISRRILAADRRRADTMTGGSGPGSSRRPAGQLALAGGVALSVPVLGVLLYLQLGSPGLPNHPFAERAQQGAAGAGAGQVADAGTEMAQVVRQLAERLARQPDNLEGWQLLARSLIQIGQPGEAAEAFRAASELAPENAELQASYGEALTLAARGIVPPLAKAAFTKSLTLDPHNPKARYYEGLANAQEGDSENALEVWTALAADTPADAPWRQILESRIREARAELGLDQAAAVPFASSTGEAAAQPPANSERATATPQRGPSAEDMAAARDMAPEDRQAMIESMVARLAGRLEENPDDLSGWLMLARSYGTLGQAEGERDALAKAAELDPKNPEILAMYGRALRKAAGNRQTEESLAVMRRLLSVDDANMQALWFVAMGEARAGRKDEARSLFDRALATLPADSPDRAELESRIEVLLAE